MGLKGSHKRRHTSFVADEDFLWLKYIMYVLVDNLLFIIDRSFTKKNYNNLKQNIYFVSFKINYENN